MDINKLIKEECYLSDNWDLANEILYKMCREHPSNSDLKSILAKTMIIGRTYAAALERRRRVPDNILNSESLSEDISDDFYIKYIVRKFKELDLDMDIEAIRNWGVIAPRELSNDQIHLILSLHNKLSEAFMDKTGIAKRSFASKYLHFHLPSVYFIYDSRAVDSVRELLRNHIKRRNELTVLGQDNGNYDREYSKFFRSCVEISKMLEDTFHTTLTIRQLDNLFMAIAMEKLKEQRAEIWSMRFHALTKD